MAQERTPEAGERQRELLSARPVARAMFRVRQSNGSLDPPPAAVVATQMALLIRVPETGGEDRSSSPPIGAPSVGNFPRGPPRARSKPTSLERT
jgi:hypothetical protein